MTYEVKIKTGLVYQNVTELIVDNQYSQLSNSKFTEICPKKQILKSADNNGSSTTTLPSVNVEVLPKLHFDDSSTQRSNNLIPTPTNSVIDARFERKDLDVNTTNVNVGENGIIMRIAPSSVPDRNQSQNEASESSPSGVIGLSVAISLVVLIVLVILLLWRLVNKIHY